MFARSTTFHGKPQNIETGIKFVKNEVAPALDQLDGCRGLSLLVDRETGDCIATSSWASEQQMMASDPPLRAIRDRGRDVFGGPMQVDEWEIAVMHRTAHGECCRVTWMQGGLETMATTFRVAVLPTLEAQRGFCSASLLLHPSGLGCATTTWETRADMEASRFTSDRLRTETAADTGAAVLDVREYELAYAHLHVPEMA